MRAPRDEIRFAAVAFVLSLGGGVAFWLLSKGTSHLAVSRGALIVPVASVILASVGFPLLRRAVYALALFAVWGMTALLAIASGLDARVTLEFSSLTALPSLWAMLYAAWLSAYPFAVLVAFVGRRPSLLWSRQ